MTPPPDIARRGLPASAAAAAGAGLTAANHQAASTAAQPRTQHKTTHTHLGASVTTHTDIVTTPTDIRRSK